MKAADSKIGLKVELIHYSGARGIICGPVDDPYVPVLLPNNWGSHFVQITRAYCTSFNIPEKFLDKPFLRFAIRGLRIIADEKTCIMCLKTRTRYDISTVDLALDGKCWSCYAK